MLDIMMQSVVYVFKLHPIPYECFHVSESSIHYNGQEVFIRRTLDIHEDNVKVMVPEGKAESESESGGVIPRSQRRREGEKEEEDDVMKVVETHIDIIVAPLPPITLYSLCRQLVLKLCPVENDLSMLPIPSRVKNDLINIRQYYR